MMMSDVTDFQKHKSSSLITLYSTELSMHMSVEANDEDQCQQAKRRDLSQRGKSEKEFQDGR